MPLSPELTTHLAGDSAGGLLWLKAHANVAEIGKAARSREMAFFHLEGQRIEFPIISAKTGMHSTIA